MYLFSFFLYTYSNYLLYNNWVKIVSFTIDSYGCMRNNIHEESLIKSFFLPGRHKRALIQLTSTRKRSQFLNRLPNLGFDYLEERFVRSLPVEKQSVSSIFDILKSEGAPKSCYVISKWKDIDCREMLLIDALTKIYNSGAGTIISIIPGRLAYYEGEKADKRYILIKSN